MDSEGAWEGRWLSGSVPTSYATGVVGELALHQPRYLSDGGRLFFDSTDGLVPTDKNGTVDAYEYEPPANDEVAQSDSCTTASGTYSPSAEGCIDLVSSGTFTAESVFIEASENGDSVFFLTAERLAKSDTDSAYDVYDAHVCGSGWECPAEAAVRPPCTSTESCRAVSPPQPAIFGAPSSATFAGQGNAVGAGQPASASSKPKAKPKPKTKACPKGKHRNRGRCVKKPKKKAKPKAGKARVGRTGERRGGKR